jgi:hypothetical protein
MNQTKKTRTILKRALVPHVESEGFVGKFPEFHRTENGELHLLSVQFDKYGGGFSWSSPGIRRVIWRRLGARWCRNAS